MTTSVPRGSGDAAAPPSDGGAGAAVAPRRSATFRMDRAQADALVKALRGGAIYIDAASSDVATYFADVLAAHLFRPTDELTIRIDTRYQE